MEIEDFRQQAHQFVDWMADYLQSVEEYPVRAQVAPGATAASLATAPPQQSEAMADMVVETWTRARGSGSPHWGHVRLRQRVFRKNGYIRKERLETHTRKRQI